MEPVTVTIVGTEVYYGVGNPREEFVYYDLYPCLNPSVSDVMFLWFVYNPEVFITPERSLSTTPEVFVTPERSLFITPEEFDIPDIDVTDVPPNVIYPEMLLRFHFYVMSSI